MLGNICGVANIYDIDVAIIVPGSRHRRCGGAAGVTCRAGDGMAGSCRMTAGCRAGRADRRGMAGCTVDCSITPAWRYYFTGTVDTVVA